MPLIWSLLTICVMTTTAIRVQESPSSPLAAQRLYWVATGLFCFMFIYSAVWTIVDPVGTRIETVRLGFPAYVIYPLAAAKLLGVAVIVWGRLRTLSGFAFAGFLYDLLLALSAHVALRESYGWVAAFGLVLWGCAFWVDRRRYLPASPR